MLTEAMLNDIENKARLASPGPWKYGKHPDFKENILMDKDGYSIIFTERDYDGSITIGIGDDGEYIAAVNPVIVLELINELRILRKLAYRKCEAVK